MRVPTLPLLALCVLVAGCAAPEEPAGPLDHAPPATVPAADPAAAQPPAAPARTNASISLTLTGRTEGEVCPGAAGQVEHCAASAAAEGTPVELPIVTRPTLLEFTLTMDAPPHASDCGWSVLRIEEGDDWRSLGQEGRVALGSSPIVASWSLAEYPPESRFHLGIYCGSDRHAAGGALTLYTGWSVPFQLELTLHHEVEAVD